MITSRRGLLLGAMSSLAAPAIVKAEILMPIRPQKLITQVSEVLIVPDYRTSTSLDQFRRWEIRIESVGGIEWETEWRRWKPEDVSLAA